MLERDNTDGTKKFMTAIGIVLIIAGSIMLLYIGLFLIKTIVKPEEVGLINLIMSRTAGGERAIFGSIADVKFDLSIDDPVATLLFLILSVWVLAALAGIVRTIVATGRELVKTAQDWEKR